MTLDPAEGLPIRQPAAPAANEDSMGLVTPPAEPRKREPAWDPHEIWRTRVKDPSNLARTREEWESRRRR